MVEGSVDGCGVLPFSGNAESDVDRLRLQGLLSLVLSQAVSATMAICRCQFLFMFFRWADAASRRLVHSGL